MCCGKIPDEEILDKPGISGKRRISRRNFVKALGVSAATMTLAGCFQSLEQLTGLKSTGSDVISLAAVDDAIAAALANSQVQELKARLEARGHRLNANSARILEFDLGKERGLQVFLPFEPLAMVAYSQFPETVTASGNVSNHKHFGKLAKLDPGKSDYEIGLVPDHKRKKALGIIQTDSKYQRLKDSVSGKYILQEDKAEFFVNTAAKAGKIMLPAWKDSVHPTRRLPDAYLLIDYTYDRFRTDPPYIDEPIWSSIDIEEPIQSSSKVPKPEVILIDTGSGGGSSEDTGFLLCTSDCLAGDLVGWSLLMTACVVSCNACILGGIILTAPACLGCLLCAAGLGWRTGSCVAQCL